MTSSKLDGESDVGELLARETGVRELATVGASRDHIPLTVTIVRLQVDAVS